MKIEPTLSLFPPDLRDSPRVRCLAVLILTLQEQLQKTQEQLQKTQEQLQKTQEQLQKTHEELIKAQEKNQIFEKELARLRKIPKKPKFRSNGMEPRNRRKHGKSGDSPEPSSTTPTSQSAQREKSEIKVQVPNLPEGSRFKGYQPFTVQEVSLAAKEITYLLEVWQTLSGEIVRAKLPEELQGKHFGPTLRALMANLYAYGMTQPALQEFLGNIGIEISSGQINNSLLDEAEGYSSESEAILEAGMMEAPFLRTDDTGEKHKHKAAYCTHIGGEFFAYYKTEYSKSRDNFLRILLQGKEGYHINEAMIWHLFQSGVDDDILNLFEDQKGKKYRSKKGLNRLFNELLITGKTLRRQCVEAALVGFASATILKPGQVLLSDRAGQFAVFDHAGCWVHMERPLRKIIASCDQVENELKAVREAIWKIYNKLKETPLEQSDKRVVNKMYDDLLEMRSISPEINAVISNFKTYREEMLKIFDHPGLPLHNNDSERDIRGVAKRRNISGSTKSDKGRKFRDGLLTLKQTCCRVGYNFWEFLKSWAKGDPPNLANLVRERYRAKSTLCRIRS